MERKRLQMLESEDPEEVEVAKNMETTISITMNYKPYEFANRQVSNSFPNFSSYTVPRSSK